MNYQFGDVVRLRASGTLYMVLYVLNEHALAIVLNARSDDPIYGDDPIDTLFLEKPNRWEVVDFDHFDPSTA